MANVSVARTESCIGRVEHETEDKIMSSDKKLLAKTVGSLLVTYFGRYY